MQRQMSSATWSRHSEHSRFASTILSYKVQKSKMAVNRYHHPSKSAAPAWSMGSPEKGSGKKKERNASPGPGTYDASPYATKIPIAFG